MSSDGGMLSERERRILEEIEQGIEGSGGIFGGARPESKSSRRLALAAILAIAGAITAVATFTVSIVAAILALTAMGAGMAAGAAPVRHLLGRGMAACRGRVGHEEQR